MYYVIDIFDEYENQKYKDFLIHLSEQTNGRKRSNRNGWQSDTLSQVTKEKFSIHF